MSEEQKKKKKRGFGILCNIIIIMVFITAAEVTSNTHSYVRDHQNFHVFLG